MAIFLLQLQSSVVARDHLMVCKALNMYYLALYFKKFGVPKWLSQLNL